MVCLNVSALFGQLPVKRDDFTGTANRGWWKWHNDGPSTPMPAVKNGFVLFSLVDPTPDYLPYCDAALWDGYPGLGGPYQYCTVTLRARALNPHRYGSRGWGLWYTEPPPNIYYTPRQQNSWFIHSIDDPALTDETWWRAETAKGIDEATHHYVDLDALQVPISDEDWHTYRISRQPGMVDFQVDGSSVLQVTQDVPDLSMAFHIWVDNLIYEYVQPGELQIHRRGWTGQNDIVLDYVQIETSGSIGSSESPEGIKLLREIPDEMGSGAVNYLWKQYNFDSPGGNTVVLATGRVEQYINTGAQPIGDDDDIRFVIDGTDYGWNTATSFNADDQGTVSQTLVFKQDIASAGSKSIDVYGDVTPLLSDVTVLGSPTGGVIVDQAYNETGSGGTDYLFKEITFPCYDGQVAVYISGTADEDPTPDIYGYQYNNFNDGDDDDLRIVLDGTDYGYQTDNSFWGNRLFGEPKSVLIMDTLTAGDHTLRLYANNTPTVYRVVVYGQFYDSSLPVTLSSFTVSSLPEANFLQWRTESEVNNLGFNIYKAAALENRPVSQLDFFRLNPILIQGAGNSNRATDYTYSDRAVQDDWYYWYRIEDVDFSGKKTLHETVKVHRQSAQPAESFELRQNYPNPFNQFTHIPYRLKEPGAVTLEIYSVSGEKVFNTALGMQNAGNHYVEWNGKDNNGVDLPTGIYYYKIRANEHSLAKSLLLMR